MHQLPGKAVGEIVTITVDFIKLTPIPANPSVDIIRSSGASDSDPSSMLVGPPFLTGSKVSQQVRGGKDGCVYQLSFWAYAPNGDKYREALELPVIA